jgi:hypothetical protein
MVIKPIATELYCGSAREPSTPKGRVGRAGGAKRRGLTATTTAPKLKDAKASYSTALEQ